MTKSTITRERIQRIIRAIDSEAYDEEEIREWLSSDEIMELSRMALAAMDSEPVFTLEVSQADYKGQKLGNHFGFITLDAARKLKEGNYQLYRHAQPGPVVLKDHQIRELVNQLRDIAIEYHGTQQLRENIARVLRAAMIRGGKP